MNINNLRCPDNVAGCKYHDDCADGHYCETDMDLPTCYDIDECDVDNHIFNGTKYCGEEATCTNSVGSFSCPCLTGFTAHEAWVGCRDINECTEGGSLCKTNAECTNTYGSHNCTCMVMEFSYFCQNKLS